VLGGAIVVTLAFLVYSSVFEDFGTRYLRAGQAGTIGEALRNPDRNTH